MLPPFDPSREESGGGEGGGGGCTIPEVMEGGEGGCELPEEMEGEAGGGARSEGRGGGGGGGGGCALPEGIEGGIGGCARSEGGEGGGGGGDSLRFLRDRLDEPLCFLLSSPFCSSSFPSLFVFSTGWLNSSSRFLENDLRGNGGGSSTRLCCGNTSTC